MRAGFDRAQVLAEAFPAEGLGPGGALRLGTRALRPRPCRRPCCRGLPGPACPRSGPAGLAAPLLGAPGGRSPAGTMLAGALSELGAALVAPAPGSTERPPAGLPAPRPARTAADLRRRHRSPARAGRVPGPSRLPVGAGRRPNCAWRRLDVPPRSLFRPEPANEAVVSWWILTRRVTTSMVWRCQCCRQPRAKRRRTRPCFPAPEDAGRSPAIRRASDPHSFQEIRRRAVQDGSGFRIGAGILDQPALGQRPHDRVDVDSSDGGNPGPGDRLAVSDDGQRLQRRLRQPGRLSFQHETATRRPRNRA